MSDLQEGATGGGDHSGTQTAADVTGRAGILRGYVHFGKGRRGKKGFSQPLSLVLGRVFYGEEGVGFRVVGERVG